MATPTYFQLVDPTQSGPGFSAESYPQRLLTIAAMIASGQNPDGTQNPSSNPQPGFGTPVANTSTLAPGSNATVTVTSSGPTTAIIFTFTFGIPQGIQGPTGATGPQGPAGTPAPVNEVRQVAATTNASGQITVTYANAALQNTNTRCVVSGTSSGGGAQGFIYTPIVFTATGFTIVVFNTVTGVNVPNTALTFVYIAQIATA